MIEQQIFIKTGIGLETLSKSQGLSDSYISSHIRPYYSPIDLFYLDSKTSAIYKSLIPLADGSLLIGSAGKKEDEPKNYIHNYIIPKKDVDAFILNPRNLVATAPGFENAPYLSSLAELPKGKKPFTFDEVFSELEITKEDYMLILAAVFAAKEEGRNVFIALRRRISSKKITLLMRAIYEAMPYFMRKSLGFKTLYGETSIKQNVNVYFVPDDKLSIQGSNYFIESYNATKDYIFRLRDKKLSYVDTLREDLGKDYFSFLAKNFDVDALNKFFVYIDEASENLPLEKKLSLRFYDDLAYIYSLPSINKLTLQQNVRATSVFYDLLRYGKKESIYSSYSAFITLEKRFIKSKSTAMPGEILKRFILSYPYCPDEIKNEIYELISYDIDICQKLGDDEAVFSHIDSLRLDKDLFSNIMEKKIAKSSKLVTKYFTHLIEQKKTVHSAMEFADKIYSDMPYITGNAIIQQMICDKVLMLYYTSGDRFEALKYLEEKCYDFMSKYPETSIMFSAIYHYALENFMQNLDISVISAQQIEKFPFTDAETINKKATIKHRIALALKELLALTNDLALSFVHYDSFGFSNIRANLSDDEVAAKMAEKQLKDELYRFLIEKKDAPKRIIYTLLFYIFEDKESRMQNDFSAIFDFLEKELEVPPYEFMEWYLSSKLFIAPKAKNKKMVREADDTRADLTMLTAFYEASRKYFISHVDVLANDKGMKKVRREMDKASALHIDFRELTQEFKKVLSGILRESYSPIKRIWSRIISARNFKFTLMAICVVIVISLGIWCGSLIARYMNDDISIEIDYSKLENAFVSRNSWSAYKVTKEGEFIPAPEAINGKDDGILLDFATDSKLVIVLTDGDGLTVNGISVSQSLSKEAVTPDVTVYDSNGDEFIVSVSDYDTETGSLLYAFKKPVSVKKITISPRKDVTLGSTLVKDVNVFSKKSSE